MGAQGSDGAGATHGQIPTQPEVRQLRQLRQGIGWNLKNGFWQNGVAHWRSWRTLAQLAQFQILSCWGSTSVHQEYVPMDEVIELTMAKKMAKRGLPGGRFPLWNLSHWETYGRQ